jgi:hypothetical protein
MKTSENQLSLDDYAYECHRKDKLLDLFTELENQEKNKKRSLPMKLRKYDRIINDHGVIKKVNEESIIWVRESGEEIEVPLTKKICELLLVGDMLVMAIGKRNKNWKIMNLIGIASEVSGQTHASFAVPEMKKPKYLN